MLVLAGALSPRQRGASVVQFELACPRPRLLAGAGQAYFGLLAQGDSPGEMPVPDAVLLAGSGKPLQRILADGLEHSEAAGLAVRLGDEQGFLHQGCDE